jgi:hypothetical protein
VNEGLAVEAKDAALDAGGGETGVVGEIEMHAVERCQPVRPRGEQDQLQRREQRQPARGLARPQIVGEVRRAHHQRRQPAPGAGDRVGGEHAARGLDHAPHRKPRRRPGAVEPRRGLRHPLGGFDLGKQHRVERQRGRRREVGLAPFGVEPVDPQHQLAPAVAAMPQRRRHGGAGKLLRLRGDGVLEVEDQPVGRQLARLLQRAQIGARHEQQAAARTDGRKVGHRHLGDWRIGASFRYSPARTKSETRMQTTPAPAKLPDHWYCAWFKFWAQFAVLGGLAILGLYVAAAGEPGDYATGLLLAVAAVLLAFLRLKAWFDGTSDDWTAFLFVDKPAHLVVVIPLFSVIALAGLFAAAGEPGTLQDAGIALFVACGLVIFLSLKRVFDKLDSHD